ncbi:hypothetical protein NGF75_06185 [Dietzia kunjamensis]|uniref:type IV toxin-antitoxin system AbiEi family antitoxin domain-containing protein n=1 Tax=Dietzia kunjamensis TaxID=322509 RepID=UPI002DB9F069|nr:type IV toxin-antitoxin system AbiEi family antitoxin domain-containing protein [Dietzia kunjamensis]MEB8325573.1 hypothetical protein [Dietzia kunjamensis]
MPHPTGRDYVPPALLSSADLAARGVNRRETAKLVDRGRLQRLRTGLYIERDADSTAADRVPSYEAARRDFVERSRAAARSVEPGTVLSHGSALALYGLPLYGVPLDRPSATRHRPGGGSRRSSALTCWNLPLDGSTAVVDGVPVTSPARTIIDVARTVGLESGVCAGDEAIRRGLVTRGDLQGEADAARGRTGAARARALPALTSGLAESVLESLIRLILVLGGVPAPDLQVWLGVRGGERFRVDLYWREWRLIGEADGFAKYGTGQEQIRGSWNAERRRQRQLEDAGYVVIRWTWEDLRHPRRIIDQVERAMRRQERLGLGPTA